MKSSKTPKLFITLLFISLSLSHNIVHDWFIDSRSRDIQETLHRQVMDKVAPAPIQYRVFVHYLAEILINSGVPFRIAYQLIRIVFTFLSLYLFFIFLRSFFVWEGALIGSLFLAATMPLTYIRYYMQPMDMPNLFFFLVSYILIIKKRDWLLIPLIFVSMLNRETAILIALVYFFSRWGELSYGSLIFRTALISITGLATYAVLRGFYQIKPYYSDLFYLNFNLSDIRTYTYALFLFGPFVFAAISNFNSKPKFLRRAVLILPFFLIIHYTMTIMVEPRLWLPILPIIIAMGLFAVLPQNMKTAETPAEKSNNRRNNGLLYLASVAVFVIFFYGFFSWYQKSHLTDRTLFLRTEERISEARRFLSAGWVEKAKEELKKGLVFSPENDELHYQLGIIYAYHLFDNAKALEHFGKCLSLNPYHLDGKRIKSEIERLSFGESKKAK